MRVTTSDTLHGRSIKIFLNGKDVSSQGYRAILPFKPGRLGLGIIWLYKLNQAGKKYAIRSIWQGTHAAWTVRVGFLRWEWRGPDKCQSGKHIFNELGQSCCCGEKTLSCEDGRHLIYELGNSTCQCGTLKLTYPAMEESDSVYKLPWDLLTITHQEDNG